MPRPDTAHTSRSAAHTSLRRPAGPMAALAAVLLGLLLLASAAACGGSESAPTDAAGAVSPAASGAPVAGVTQTATFAAGCFWGVEEHFASLPGVVDVVVGYTGGTTEGPTYEQVCAHTTGHAEAARVEFDPDVVSYEELVESFFAMHDPTTLDRQGPDVGDQYRSAVFFHTPRQEATARAVLRRLEEAGVYDDPIVTEITPAGPFWRAEDYHQDYFAR